jgi:hypothetical protein
VSVAEPDHVHGHATGLNRLEVGHTLIQGEEVVHGSLDDQRGRPDLLHQIGRAFAGEPPVVRRADRPRRQRVLVGRRHVRITVGRGGEGIEQVRPPALRCIGLVEACGERVPGDLRDDGVDPTILGGRHELDAPAVGAADHAHSRIPGGVQLHTGPCGHPVNQSGHVTCFIVRAVNFNGSRRLTKSSRVPGQDVVPVAVESRDGQTAENVGRARGRTGFAPPRTLQDGGLGVTGTGSGCRKPVSPYLGAVK